MTVSEPAERTENAYSPLLPGGNLISASLDRPLMIWSDRGGASRHIGDRWAIQSAEALRDSIGTPWPVPHAELFTLIEVIRLDDVPEVSREANLHHLENPDFLLIGSGSHTSVLQAVDAKFAADRIKPSQVSADVVKNLLAVENGVTRSLVSEAIDRLGLSKPSVVRGVFVVPDSELTDYLIRRVTTARNPSVDPQEVVRVSADPATMFAGLPESRLIGSLARIDALPVTPRTSLISAIYYFRLACGCFYLWSEAQRPLLTNRDPSEPEPGIVAAEVSTRAASASSAYDLVATWAVDVEPHARAREAVANVASLPLRMRDIRSRVEQAGDSGENRTIRHIRRDLEIAFRSRLIELTGEIRADDPRSLSTILDDVARASRSLAPEMRALLDELVQNQVLDERRDSPTAV